MTYKLYILILCNILMCCTNRAQNIETENASYIPIDTLWRNKIEKDNSYWQARLSDRQFKILRKKGTERPFTHPYNDNKETGIYVCVACNNPLYSSNAKFNSGTGWPSFLKPYFTKSVSLNVDKSHGMTRNEVICGRCGGHLGHVFNDGPQPTGLRYCMNGEALRFVEQDKTENGMMERAVFAQGCFWCVEEIFEEIRGVKEVISGYSGGTEPNPTYKQVGSGATSHAEAVEVLYDPTKISYDELLKVYFNSGDITQVNGQGNDIGTQYRSIVFYKDEMKRQQIDEYILKLKQSGKYKERIAVEVLPFHTFYPAEKYHQDYVKLNPNQGYVKAVSIPRFRKAIKQFSELLKTSSHE